MNRGWCLRKKVEEEEKGKWNNGFVEKMEKRCTESEK